MSTEKERSTGGSDLLEDFSDPEVRVAPEESSENNFTGMENSPLVNPQDTSSGKLLRYCPKANWPSCTPRTVWRWLLNNLLLLLTIASVIVGAVVGLSVRSVDLPKDSEGYRLMVTLLGFPGELFLRMLKMLILPLIVFSLIAGLGSLETKVAGSLGWKTVLYYGTTTALAVVLGLVLVNVIKPGERQVLPECTNSTLHSLGHELKVIDSILDLLR